MSEKTRTVSQWKLLLVGTTSLVGRRLFVVALSVLSLAVWSVTVVGTGLFRRGGGPQWASGSVALVTPSALLAQMQVLSETSSSEATPSAALVPVEAAPRDPFGPSESWFPKPKSHLDAQQAGQLKDGEGKGSSAEDFTLTARDLAALRVEGTLLSGSDRVAIVRGNSLRLGGRTMILVGGGSGGTEPGERVTVLSADGNSRVRVGDELTACFVVSTEGRYRLTEESVVLTVKEITHRGLTLLVGEKEYLLEMGK